MQSCEATVYCRNYSIFKLNDQKDYPETTVESLTPLLSNFLKLQPVETYCKNKFKFSSKARSNLITHLTWSFCIYCFHFVILKKIVFAVYN